MIYDFNQTIRRFSDGEIIKCTCIRAMTNHALCRTLYTTYGYLWVEMAFCSSIVEYGGICMQSYQTDDVLACPCDELCLVYKGTFHIGLSGGL